MYNLNSDVTEDNNPNKIQWTMVFCQMDLIERVIRLMFNSNAVKVLTVLGHKVTRTESSQ